MVKARYICSAKIARTIWCEKVMRESDSFALACLNKTPENQYGQPITSTRRFTPLFIRF